MNKDEIELDDVLEWADGILGALGTEYARTVSEREVRIAQAIDNQLRLEQLADPNEVFKVRIFIKHPRQFQTVSRLLEPRFRSPAEASEFIRNVFGEEYIDAVLLPHNQAAVDFLSAQHHEWNGYEFEPVDM